MPSATSWKKSLSPVTMATSNPVRARLYRQRADDVVGLVALVGEDRNAERFTRLAHERDLLGEVGRHRRAVGLVVGRELVAERRAGQIERRGDVLRRVIGDELAQHRREAVHGIRRSAVRTRQPAYRVIRAVHLRATVDEKQASHVFLDAS